MSAQSILKRLYDDEQWIDAQADAIALIEKQADYIAALEAVAEAADEQFSDLKQLLKDIEDYDSGKPIDWIAVRISLSNFHESSIKTISTLSALRKAQE